MSQNKSYWVPRRQVDILLQEAIRYGANYHRRGAGLYRIIKADPDHVHPSDFRDLSDIVEDVKSEARNGRFDVPIPYRPGPNPGEGVELGDIQPFRTMESHLPVGLYFSELAQTTGVAGRSGGGKSTINFNIVNQSSGKGLSCFLIDSKGDPGGGQFRALSYLYPGRVLYAKVGRTVFHNPWRRLKNIIACFMSVYERHDSSFVLDQVLNLFESRSKLTGALAPTLESIIEMVGEVRSPIGLPAIDVHLKKSLLTVLLQMQSSLGISTDCQIGWNLGEIIKRGLIVIVDTSEIAGTNHEEFVICSLLSEIRDVVRSDPNIKSQNKAKVVFCVDESTTIVGRRNDVGRRLSPMAHLATLVRSSEVVLILAFHSPRNVSDIIRSTMSVFICASLTNGGDVLAVRDSAFLTDAQAEALTHMPVGTAMMKMANRFTHPFLITCDPIPDYPPLSEAEIDANNSAILATLPPVVPADFRKSKPLNIQTPSAQAPDTDTDRIYLLRHIEDQPFLNLTERADAIALPSGKKTPFDILKIMLEHLRETGFCDFIEIRVRNSGRTPEFWFLTDAGIDVVGYGQKPLRGGTSHAHFFAQRLVCKLLAERGIQAQMEAVI